MESALDINGGAAAFAEILSADETTPEVEQPELAVETPEKPEVEADDVQPEGDEAEVSDEEQPELITIKVDGKEVQVTLDELKNGYQRQADYTKKTMEVSEQRKAAEAEIVQARQEREAYAQKLQTQEAVLINALQEQSQIDWNQLLETDPVEYLKQQHLYQQRQAAYQNTLSERQQLAQQTAAEQQKALADHLQAQRDELLAKLPEWKDPKKFEAERTAIKIWMAENGFQQDEIDGVSNARHVITARKAMLYDQIMSKAQASAKKVENLPKKVLASGNGNSPTIDKRTAAFNRLSKSGSIEDAASVFASIL